MCMYNDLNEESKNYLEKELKTNFYKKYNDDFLLERCYREINILYDKKMLFIIRYLYDYKKENRNVSYFFKGTINNLLLLYVLDITNIDVLKYNLPYQLFNDSSINLYLINDHPFDFIWYIESLKTCKVLSCFYEKNEIDELNNLLNKHYMLVPCNADIPYNINEYGMMETIEDYRNYTNDYVVLRVDEKEMLTYNDVRLDNVFESKFENEIAELLIPKKFDDFVKINALSHGANIWLSNQEKYFKSGLVNLNNLIATREDIYDYLIDHNIDINISVDIVNYICRSHNKTEDIWNNYVSLMRRNSCDDLFIEVISNILYISPRGQSISECLYVLDKNNYIK